MWGSHNSHCRGSTSSWHSFPSPLVVIHIVGAQRPPDTCSPFPTNVGSLTIHSPSGLNILVGRSSINVRSHNPCPKTSSGLNVFVDTRSSLQSMWDLTIHPPLGSNSSRWQTAWCLSPSGSTSLLVHSPVSGFDTICNSSSPLLADIVLFGFFLSSFPILKHFW